MLYPAVVTSQKELEQIQELNHRNLKQNLSVEEQMQEGFVSWPYSLELLEQMNGLAPSIIVKQEEEVVGYALVTLVEASAFHEDLELMLANVNAVQYKGKPLAQYDFYLMGQVCVKKGFRGKRVFNLLYQEHKKIYSKDYELLVTEISAKNKRSLKAHEKLGFEIIHKYKIDEEEWIVVAWNWLSPNIN